MYSAVICSAVQYSAVQYGALKYNVLQSSAVQQSAMLYGVSQLSSMDALGPKLEQYSHIT